MEELDTSSALADCLARSNGQPLFIFKHSTRCPISSGAHSEVEAYLREAGDASIPVYINYVVESRAVSNEIAQLLGIRHESPQLMLVFGGAAVWNVSHGSIRASEMVRVAASQKDTE